MLVKPIDNFKPSVLDSEVTEDNYFEDHFDDPYSNHDKEMEKHQTMMKMCDQTQKEFFKVRLNGRRLSESLTDQERNHSSMNSSMGSNLGEKLKTQKKSGAARLTS